MSRAHDSKDSSRPGRSLEGPGTNDSATPLRSFARLENERQREWLFNRHRRRRPSWLRD